MNGQYHTVNSERTMLEFVEYAKAKFYEFKWYQAQLTTEKQRSQLQNNSLHMWCDWVAKELNDKGYDIRRFIQEISQRMDIPWSGSAVKELLWRPVQIEHTGKQSSTKASSTEFPVISDCINKAMGEHMGIYVPWPDRNNMRRSA